MSGPTLRLDRSRYFSTIHGEVEHGHAFTQDGLPFDNHGNLIDKLVTKEQRPLVEKKLRRIAKISAPSDSAADPNQQPDGAGASAQDDSNDTAEDGDDDDDGEDATEVNLEMWLRDQVKYQPHVLFKEVRKRYSKVFSNFQQVAEFLVFEENLLGPEEVPTKLKARD